MLASLLRRPWLLGVALVAVVALLVGGAVAVFGRRPAPPRPPAAGEPRRRVAAPAIPEVTTAGIAYAPTLVVYNGRSHYGDEKVFRDFEAATGVKLELRGGTGPELFERLRREGADTPADVYVTTDLANLWRAEQAGLLQGVTSPTLRAQIPESRRDAAGNWWALSTRLRVPVVLHRARPGRSRHQLREPRRPAVQRPHLPADVQQRVQPVAGRRHDRQARPRGHRDAAAVLDGERPADHQLRRRDARGDRRGRLRRRPGQPLLPGPDPQGRPRLPGRPRAGRTRTARARTRTSPASAWSRARRTSRRPWR